MRASLADQACLGPTSSLAIALGANLPSPAGDPIATLVAVRPQLEQVLQGWWAACGAPPVLQCHWSPLFATEPEGGPPDQPVYCNAVLLVEAADGLSLEPDSGGPAAALTLLQGLHALERRYGRQRHERWGPRSLDLDLLWWGELHQATASLDLPHPRWHQRAFVLAPLLAIDQRLGRPVWRPPGASAAPSSAPSLVPLPARSGWPE